MLHESGAAPRVSSVTGRDQKGEKMTTRFLSKAAAEAEGYTVDTHVYPWFAYKGPRFLPEVARYCLTDREAEMLAALKDIVTADESAGTMSLAAGMARIATALNVCRAAIAKAEGRAASPSDPR